MDRQLSFKKLLDLDVIVMDELREKYPEKFNESGAMDWQWFESEIRPSNFIYVRYDKNSLSFTIKDKPTSQGGKGAEAVHLIEAARQMIGYLHTKHPCEENEKTLECLKNALTWQHHRTENRIKRNVEGIDAD